MAAVLVIDASVAVRLVTHTCGQDDWGAQLEEAALVLAPELMLTDAANAPWKLRRSNAFQQVEPDRTLQAEALALASCCPDRP